MKLLNEYFASIFTKENLVDIPMYNKASYKNTLNTVDFTEETVYDKVCKFRADKSTGVDGIYPVVLKNLANVILKPLSHIFYQSLLCNIVPHDWKLANATPLFKKGPKNKASSYRPARLTSQVCKIMESILKENIINHLEQNGSLEIHNTDLELVDHVSQICCIFWRLLPSRWIKDYLLMLYI